MEQAGPDLRAAHHDRVTGGRRDDVTQVRARAGVGLLALAIAVLTPRPVAAWGYVAHRIVVENAAPALPAPLAAFYAANLRLLSDASIEPDSLLRGREGDKEARRHYFNLDELSRPPFRDLPFDEDEARSMFGDERLERAGHLPWRILSVLDQLRDAHRKKDWAKVVSRSGWLSHYVADSYQPLHTTRNHDGRDSCNQGVHAAFETDMIDRLKARYRLETALPTTFVAEVIREPRRFVFGEILGNYELVDEILRADTAAMLAVKRQRSDYYEEMEGSVGRLARRQMSRAAATTANLWYTAWFQGGRPELPDKPVAREARP